MNVKKEEEASCLVLHSLSGFLFFQAFAYTDGQTNRFRRWYTVETVFTNRIGAVLYVVRKCAAQSVQKLEKQFSNYELEKTWVKFARKTRPEKEKN